jgi:hypothetical protein
LLKQAVVASVRAAALLHTTSAQISLPPVVRKAISLLLSIGPETHKTVCKWLMQGCQIVSNDTSAPAADHTSIATDDPQAAAAHDSRTYATLTRSICEGNKFFAELCKYLAAESQDIERSLRFILHSVISESAALSTLLTCVSLPCSIAPLPSPRVKLPCRFVKENPAEPDFIPQLLSSIFSSFKVNDDGTVNPLPDASASEIETLAIIAEHCIHAALQDHAGTEEAADESCAELDSTLFLEVDAMDYCKKWYKAVVIEGNLHGDDAIVRVHFVGCKLHSHASIFTLQPAPNINLHIAT